MRALTHVFNEQNFAFESGKIGRAAKVAKSAQTSADKLALSPSRIKRCTAFDFLFFPAQTCKREASVKAEIFPLLKSYFKEKPVTLVQPALANNAFCKEVLSL